MAAFFVDLDGTVFYWGTENFLPNVVDVLKSWEADGHQIIFTTMRDEKWANVARLVLKQHLSSVLILSRIDSPRVVVNDDGAVAINHPKDTPWPSDYSSVV